MENKQNSQFLAVAYARVSSKEQEQGYSLDAQQRLAEEYAKKKDITIDHLYKISESASGKKMREVFLEMLEYARKNKINIILVEKTDRLIRGLKEAVLIQEWLEENHNNQVHSMKDNLVLCNDSRASDKLMWGVTVTIAKYYIDNLSEEVKKGLNEKAKQGLYPGSFKLGYLSVGEKGKKRFIKDDKTWPQVKSLLSDYASGNFSMKTLAEKAWDIGLRSRYGKRLYKNQVESLLKDPFYYGSFWWKEQIIKGLHEPLISKETYDMIHEVRTRRKAPGHKQHKFLFTKILLCGECNGTLTSEIQKGFIYCHCSGYRDCSQNKYARQESLEAQLIEVMKIFEGLTPKEAEAIEQKIKAKHQVETDYKLSVIDSLNGQYRGAQAKIERLYDDRLSGIISPEFWSRKNEELMMEQKGIGEQLERMKNQDTSYHELHLDIIKLAQRAKEIYLNENRTDEEKRLLLKYLFEVIKVKDGEVSYELKSPVRKYAERLKMPENIFEPEKSFIHNSKTSSDVRTAMMLPG